MRTCEGTTVRQRLLAVLAAVVLISGIAGLAGSSAVEAQSGIVSDELICAVLFGFAAEPVPVAKSADGETVLASVEWGYNADHNLCYLVLDDTAVNTLRANPPVPTAQPSTDADKAAATQCHNAYNSDRGFAAEPVPVVKSTDGQSVLASVKWGYSPDHDLCYLILDEAAQQSLLTHHPCAVNPGSRDCRGTPSIAELQHNLLWSPDGTRTAYVDTTYVASALTDSIYVADRLGNNPKPIASGFTYPNLVQYLTWSPDGTQLAFSHVHGHGYRGGIRVVNADGSGEIAWLSRCGKEPEWSPDGTRIAFQVERTPGCNQTRGTYIVDTDGSGLVKIADILGGFPESFRWNADDREVFPGNPYSQRGWSPSGTFQVYNCSPFNILCVTDAYDSLAVPIGSGFSPRWSPDERQIAFLTGNSYSTKDGFFQSNGDAIVVVDSDGTNSAEIVRIADLPESTNPMQNTCSNWFFVSSDIGIGATMQFIPGANLIFVIAQGIGNYPSDPGCLSGLSNRYFIVEMPAQSRADTFDSDSSLTPFEAFSYAYHQALAAPHNTTDGANWTNNANWNTDEPIHTWHGITTRVGGTVELRLPDNNLTGSIPSEVGNLTGLTYLNISGNGLTGAIPQEVGNLTGLTYLYLSDNNLTGAIPHSLAALTDLEYFYSSGNSLCLPEELRKWHDAIQYKNSLPEC